MSTDLDNLVFQVRRDILRMVHKVNSGHPGGSLGCTEFFVVLFKFLVIDESGASSELSDIILEIISCGDEICTDEYENCLLCNEDCGECDD